MNSFLSATSGSVYKHIARPLLFRVKPDTVHHQMLKSAIRLQRFGIARATMRAAWSYYNPVLLSQELHGIRFDNPVGLSAGFDANFELAPTLKAVGFGFMEGGSLTFQPCAGNPKPWFYRLPQAQSLVVNKGLANNGVEAILKHIQAYPAETFAHFPLNISVAKTNSPAACTDDDAITDYVGSLHALKKAGVGDMVTINISCPNTYGGEPFTTAGRLDRLLKAVDEAQLKQPIFIKMPSHLEWPDFDTLLKVIVQHHIAGVTISNLSTERQQYVQQGILPQNVPGKLSGKPTFRTSNKLIARTYRQYGKRLTIIGVGGIFSAEDAYTKIQLGASLVELITGLIYEGPQLIGQINRGLADLLTRDGFTNIRQAIGSAHKALNDVPG